MGLEPQRIDNLVDFLDKIEASLNTSDLITNKKAALIETLRLEVIEVLKDCFC